MQLFYQEVSVREDKNRGDGLYALIFFIKYCCSILIKNLYTSP